MAGILQLNIYMMTPGLQKKSLLTILIRQGGQDIEKNINSIISSNDVI
jgi:hypothetical protein